MSCIISDISMAGRKRFLAQGEIRLIQLLPGMWDEDIQCEHVYTFLARKPEYTALSYVWGSSKAQSEVILNNKPHSVTRNLLNALRYFRHTSNVTTLWIDALSIDQSDVKERSEQVSMMDKIYQSAKQVVVYLGDRINKNERIVTSRDPPHMHFTGNNDDQNRIAVVQEIALNAQREQELRQIRKSHGYAFEAFCLIRLLAENAHLTELLSIQQSPKAQTYFSQLCEILRRMMHSPWTPWWSRAWVVQEIVMAQQVTMMYGKISSSWSMFADAAASFTRHYNTCCAKAIWAVPHDCLKVLTDFSQRVQDIEELRLAQFSTVDPSIPYELGTHWSARHVARVRPPLLHLLRKFRSRKATDPRDKVYALINLAKTSIRPNYALSTRDVFIETVLRSIAEEQSLSILIMDQGRKFRTDLPSWVPDWEAQEDPGHQFWSEAAALYNSVNLDIQSDTCAFDMNSIRESSRLPVNCVYVGTVTAVGDTMWAGDDAHCRATLGQWLSLLSVDPRVAMTEVREPRWRFLCAGVIRTYPDASSVVQCRRTERCDDEIFTQWCRNSQRSPLLPTGQLSTHGVPTGPEESIMRLLVSTTSTNGPVDYETKNTVGGNTISIMDSSILKATLNRKLLILDTGHVVLGPHQAYVGDRVFLVRGSPTPFVLRHWPHWIARIPRSPGNEFYTIPDKVSFVRNQEREVKDSVEPLIDEEGRTLPALRADRITRPWSASSGAYSTEITSCDDLVQQVTDILTQECYRWARNLPYNTHDSTTRFYFMRVFESLAPASKDVRLHEEKTKWWYESPLRKSLFAAGLDFDPELLAIAFNSSCTGHFKDLLYGIISLDAHDIISQPKRAFSPLFQLVGPCYLHDMMDTEKMSPTPIWREVFLA